MGFDKKGIAKNSFYIFLMNIFDKAFGFIATILVARILSTSDYGVFTATFALATLFLAFFELGFPLIIPKFLSQDKDDSNVILTGSFLIVIVVYPAIFIALTSYIFLFGWGIKEMPVLIIFLAVFTQSLFGFAKLFKGVYLAKNTVHYDATLTFISRIFLCALLGFAIFLPSLGVIYFAYILSNIVYILLLFKFFKKINIHFIFRYNSSSLKKLLSNMAPFVLIAIFYNIYSSLDALLIFNKMDNAATAYFGGAKRLFQTFMLIPITINTAFYPTICKTIKIDSFSFVNSLKTNLLAILAIALPIAVGVYVYSHEIIILTLGYKFQNSATLLQIFAPVLILSSILNFMGNIIYAFDRLKLFVFIVLADVLINVTLNIIFIPLWGSAGSCVALLMTELTVLIYLLFDFGKIIKSLLDQKIFYITLINVLLVAFILFLNLLVGRQIGFFIALVSAPMIYIVLLKTLKIFDLYNIFKNIFTPERGCGLK